MHGLLPPPPEHAILRPMQRYLNIAGLCIPAEHYMVPALDRLPGARWLLAQGQCFVAHAPRQTGKKTALKGLLHGIGL